VLRRVGGSEGQRAPLKSFARSLHRTKWRRTALPFSFEWHGKLCDEEARLGGSATNPGWSRGRLFCVQSAVFRSPKSGTEVVQLVSPAYPWIRVSRASARTTGGAVDLPGHPRRLRFPGLKPVRLRPLSSTRASFGVVRVLTALDRPQVEDLRRRDEFFWLDLKDPSDDDLNALQEIFGFHPLSIEDTREFGQRPKLESYGDYVFVVFYGARTEGDRVGLTELHMFLSGSYVISIRRELCAELEAVRATLEKAGARGEQFILYKIFDALTDSFFPVLSGMDEQIDEIENEIIQQPTDQQLQTIFQLKRDLVAMRRVVTPQRDLFARAIDDITALPGLEPSAHDYFRDVYDHLIRISEQIDSYRDLLTSAMDVYLSTVSNRLNQVMKQLTIIATIFLPLSFVTGFFGQNFLWLVQHIDTFGAFLAYGVGGVLVALVLLVGWFRRAGYL
jgi:magnesium transporter